jgi:hypothetical protein
MMYLLLLWGDEAVWAAMSPEDQAAEFEAYGGYTRWLNERGWMKGGEALLGSATARHVRVREGERLVSDGPFAETKEQLGGFYLIECDTEDDALEAAAHIPAARGGVIEVRPVMDLGG